MYTTPRIFCNHFATNRDAADNLRLTETPRSRTRGRVYCWHACNALHRQADGPGFPWRFSVNLTGLLTRRGALQ